MSILQATMLNNQVDPSMREGLETVSSDPISWPVDDPSAFDLPNEKKQNTSDFKSKPASDSGDTVSPADEPPNKGAFVGPLTKEDHLTAFNYGASWESMVATNPACIQTYQLTGGPLNKPTDFSVIEVSKDHPVLIGSLGDQIINATSGYLVKGPDNKVSYLSEKEFKEKAQEAEDIKEKEGMRGGTLLSALLKTPLNAFKSAFNAGLDLAKEQYSKDHLSRFREEKIIRNAHSATTHFNNSSQLINEIMKDPRVAPFVSVVDRTEFNTSQAALDERGRAQNNIMKTIDNNTDLSSKLKEAIHESSLATKKHTQFFEEAEKFNLRPEKLAQVEQIDSEAINKLKKSFAKFGDEGATAAAIKDLDKMTESIRESVKRMVDKLQGMLGVKNG